jgi:dTDP-4-dehydrorhamnose reductase
MDLLITGAGGLLGGRLARHLAPNHRIILLAHNNDPGLELETRRLDLRLGDDHLERLLDEVSPELIIHCAAEARPAEFSREPEGARRLNVEAPERLARWCRRRDRRLIHFSSDTVYPGDGPCRHEDSPTGPANAYGHSKLEAERRVLAQLPEATLFRMSLLYGPPVRQGHSFSSWLLARAQAGGPVPVFSDNLRNMLALGQACTVVARALHHPLPGICNLGGGECLSREQFARRLFRHLGLDEGLLQPSRQQDTPLEVPLPRDLQLDLERLESWLGQAMPGVEAGLEAEFPSLSPAGPACESVPRS